MWQFIKYLFASLIALTIFVLGAILLMVGIFSVSDAKIIEANSVLKLNFDKPITEVSHANPLEELHLPMGDDKASIGLVDIKKAIVAAKTDAKIKGIYLNLSKVRAGFASLQEIRTALVDFKKSGKFIVAYGESFSEGAYYLASSAHQIYLAPEGLLEFNGIGTQLFYFKNLFEKLEIKPEVFKVGDYKSAVEPFLLDKMSDHNRNQLDTLLNGVYTSMLTDIAASRQISVGRLRLISDSMYVHNANDAVRFKLITHLGYYDQVESALRQKLGIHLTTTKIKLVDLGDYVKSLPEVSQNEDKKIAVIVATGEIHQGNSVVDEIGSADVCEQLRKARNNPKVKAIVLRINSPGGSALASDLMWREIVITRRVKPVIASMSDMAASGGYYMAMACNKIVAQPTTITGSIGVFGLIFNIKNTLSNKFGITVDGYQTGKFSDVGSVTREMTDYERKIIQSEVAFTYEEFLRKAAEGRKVNIEVIRKVAGGRVWTGTQAKAIGLVDELGGLQKAIDIAAASAKLGADYSVMYVPEHKNWLEALFEDKSKDAQSKMIAAELGELYPYFKTLQKINTMKGVQARVPFELVVE
ncbi:MAG: signal peptide peptidase SppA [Bacteroidota bacterium]